MAATGHTKRDGHRNKHIGVDQHTDADANRDDNRRHRDSIPDSDPRTDINAHTDADANRHAVGRIEPARRQRRSGHSGQLAPNHEDSQQKKAKTTKERGGGA